MRHDSLRHTRHQVHQLAPPLALSLGFALFAPAALAAQVSPNGPELQVNTRTALVQDEPRVAVGPQGEFVVVWTSDFSDGNDSSSTSVQLRRFLAGGTPLGSDLQANAYTSGPQERPAVAVDGLGRIVVVWQSYGSPGPDGDLSSVHARRFDANGAPLGADFQVNTFTTSVQMAPRVAADAAGNFVVVWASQGSPGNDNAQLSIQAQRFDALAAPLGPQFQVNTYTTGSQWQPAVAAHSQGGFVVAWTSAGSAGGDTSNHSVQARRFDGSGAPLGPQFQVNSYTTNFQTYPSVAVDGQGDFVVAWQSWGSSGPDGEFYGIVAQRYDAAGNPQGGELQVNAYTTSGQLHPAVAADARGDFVVAWGSNGSAGSDASHTSVQAQRFAATGAPLGGEFQVNTYTTSYQDYPSAAADALGNFVVAWQSDGSNGTDNSALSIQAQRYDGLFRDGFESGGTARWSATLP